MFTLSPNQLLAFDNIEKEKQLKCLEEWTLVHFKNELPNKNEIEIKSFVKSIHSFCNECNIYELENISKTLFFEVRFQIISKFRPDGKIKSIFHSEVLNEYQKMMKIRAYLLNI
jgi:hypothetical protein